MAFDPTKHLAKFAAPALQSMRKTWALREADAKPTRFWDVDREINAALDVLSQNATTLPSAIGQFLKGKLADRPDVFAEEPVPQWLRTDKVRKLVAQAVYAYLRAQSGDEFADEAATFFAKYEEAEGPGRGYAAFEYAVPFVLLNLANAMSTADRLIMHAVGDLGSKVDAALAPVPQELLDRDITEQIETIRRARPIEGIDTTAQAQRLADRVHNGDLSRASQGIRAEGLAICARYMLGKLGPVFVEPYIDASRSIMPTEQLIIAEGHVLANVSIDEGLAHLAPINSAIRRHAALQMVARKDSAEAIVDWARKAGIEAEHLDSDGRLTLLLAQVGAGVWEDAFASLECLTPADIERTPALGYAAAVAHLLQAVPDDLRHVVLSGPPFDPLTFPLFDTQRAVETRRRASTLFREASNRARELGGCDSAAFYASFAVWLDLRDSDYKEAATAEIAELLRGEEAVRWIALALAFEIADDIDRIEMMLDRQGALNPKGSRDLAWARLAMAMRRDTPEQVADYVARHRDLLANHLDPAQVATIEIGVLIAAGRGHDAQVRLAEVETEIDPDQATKYREQIASGALGMTLAQLEADYEANPSTANLAPLVGALGPQGYSERFVELATRLTVATQGVDLANNVVNLLLSNQKWDEVGKFLARVPDLIDRSRQLLTAHAWNAYAAGNLKLAQKLVVRLQADADDGAVRSLRHNLLLVSGRWPDIAAYVEEQWSRREERDALELLNLAQLASQVGSDRVAELMKLSVAKAPQNAHVLAGSFMLATQAGLENLSERSGWLETAAALSGEDGPIQKVDLKKLVEAQPDWDQHTDAIWDQVRAGSMPLYLAAHALRRASLELRLAAMIANGKEPDPRRRAPVPAFSGVRGRPALKATRLALDGGALVTLATLGILDRVVARGGAVISHNTLGWLFQERQRLAFHQPSRIQFAHRLQREIGAGRAKRFSASAPVDGKLADAIGHGLAAMLASAMERQEGAPQRLVVRSSSVERLGTFSGETVDLSEYADVLCSCQHVVDKLTDLAQLGTRQAKDARVYLEMQEQRWPAEPTIEDSAELYLDDLSVSYLNTAGVLDKIHAAGLKVIISERQIDEMNGLIELEARAEDIEQVIERVRRALAEGMEAGLVELAPLANETTEIAQHPDLRVIDLAGKVDAIVADDRYLNKMANIEGLAGVTPIWTSLDLIELLLAEGVITAEELVEYRAHLRRAGLVLFPIETDELTALIDETKLRDDELVETAELRAFRENLQLALMRRHVSLPDETEYMQALLRATTGSICQQWKDTIPDDVARARSRWLLARADLRNWAGVMGEGAGDGIATNGLAIPINMLVNHRHEVEEGSLGRYDAWLREVVFQQLQFEDPTIYEWLLKTTRTVITELGNQGQSDA